MVKIFSLLAEILTSMDKKRDVQPKTSDMPELEKHTRILYCQFLYQLLYSLYRSKRLTKTIYNNLINTI